MSNPTTPDGRAEIRKRAVLAQAARNDIHRCEFLRVTPAPHSHRQVAASQADVPALLDALDKADEQYSSAVESCRTTWLLAEKQEKEKKFWAKVANGLALEQEKGLSAITRVRELHTEQISRTIDHNGDPETYCDACGIGPYPCPTVRALDGDS